MVCTVGYARSSVRSSRISPTVAVFRRHSTDMMSSSRLVNVTDLGMSLILNTWQEYASEAVSFQVDTASSVSVVRLG